MTELASLTQTEAEERAALIDVLRYDIEIDWRGLAEGPTSRSVSTITFTCREPGAETFVDATGTLVSASLNGQPLDVASVSAGRLPLTALAGANVLVVEMTQDQTGTSEGILKTVDKDGSVYVWTSFEPDDARRVFACFDQPDLKAPHRFVVTVPDAWTVTSNTGRAAIVDGEGFRTWTFADTPRLSTYVTVVNAGPFHEIRDHRGGHDIGIFCRQSLIAPFEREAEEIFTITEQGLAFFAEKFQQPFPQERLDHVFVPNMGGAMENWGCITYADGFIPISPPTYGERSYYAETILHEMAHLWFGDLVTMKWWDDLWLNEAFASFASTWAGGEATRYDDMWATFSAVWKQWGYDEDASPATHPIRGQVPDVAQAMANFDGISYAKGQAVLAQLMHFIGEDAFSAGLAAYFRKHAWGNTTLADLMAAFSESSGRDLADWTTAWLDTAGTDTIRIEDGAVVVTGPDGGSSPRRHRLDIGSYAAGPDGLRLVAVTSVETTGDRTPVSLPDADLHLPNDNDLTFAKVALDAGSRDTLVAHAADLPDSLSRALAIGTAVQLVKDGELGSTQALPMLLAMLGRETTSGLIRPLVRSSLELARSWTPLADIAPAKAQMADAVRPLLEHPEFGPDARRALAQVATEDADFDALSAASQDDLELAWLVQARKAALGRYDADAVAALQERDPDPEAWVGALAARTARPLDEAKAEAWAELYDKRSVPADKLHVLVPTFWLPEQGELLRPWCERYLAELPKLAGGSMLTMFGLIGGMFPGIGDDAFLAEVEQMIDDPDTHPVIKSSLQASGDRLRRILRARG